ncbi:MAG: hypothetical protein JWM80_99 [Cyanobacteria bacterium RYN_339]|nr:hypothetical protein [Cyanobacteria bacterium RYN_339]
MPLDNVSGPRLPIRPTANNARPPVAPAVATPEPVVPQPQTPKAPTLREQVAIAEQLTGKKSHFETEPQLQAYLTSLEKALPQEAYDRQGFLASIGLTGVRASGRTDRPVLDAVLAQPGYVPNDDSTGKEIWIQGRMFSLAKHHPGLFLGLTHVTNPILEAKGRVQGKWKKPLDAIDPVPSNVPVAERYKAAIATQAERTQRFGPDVHGGIPNVDGPVHPTYGTYAIAMAMGFDDAAARRFGTLDVGIDNNATRYGKTSPMPLDQIDRHFNLDRDEQDTRLVYAQDHLALAIKLARATDYDQAEKELGCGLHSLQDLFAHGQITPSLHAVLGQFPDDVDWNPVAFYEATGATQAYLAAYLKAIREPG